MFGHEKVLLSSPGNEPTPSRRATAGMTLEVSTLSRQSRRPTPKVVPLLSWGTKPSTSQEIPGWSPVSVVQDVHNEMPRDSRPLLVNHHLIVVESAPGLEHDSRRGGDCMERGMVKEGADFPSRARRGRSPHETRHGRHYTRGMWAACTSGAQGGAPPRGEVPSRPSPCVNEGRGQSSRQPGISFHRPSPRANSSEDTLPSQTRLPHLAHDGIVARRGALLLGEGSRCCLESPADDYAGQEHAPELPAVVIHLSRAPTRKSRQQLVHARSLCNHSGP